MNNIGVLRLLSKSPIRLVSTLVQEVTYGRVATLHKRTVAVGLTFFFHAEDGIRGLVRSRGLGDVYEMRLFEQGPLLLDVEMVLEHLENPWELEGVEK